MLRDQRFYRLQALMHRGRTIHQNETRGRRVTFCDCFFEAVLPDFFQGVSLLHLCAQQSDGKEGRTVFGAGAIGNESFDGGGGGGGDVDGSIGNSLLIVCDCSHQNYLGLENLRPNSIGIEMEFDEPSQSNPFRYIRMDSKKGKNRMQL